MFVFTFLEVVSYDVSDGFPKKVWMVGGWGLLYPVLFWIFWDFPKSLSTRSQTLYTISIDSVPYLSLGIFVNSTIHQLGIN